MKRMTKEEWLRRAVERYGDRFDYSLFTEDYKNSKQEIQVKCKKHNIIFKTKTYEHIHGQISCKQCISEMRHNINAFTEEEFLKKCKEIDEKLGNDISIISEYKNEQSKIKVRCNKCGYEWEQLASNRLKGQKCPRCIGRIVSQKEFINKAKAIHGSRYDYSLVEYKTAWTDVKIKCNKCGRIFTVKPHLHAGKSNQNGCPFCNESIGERKIRVYCENNKIKFTSQKIFDDCKYINKLKFDFFLDDYNIAIEFDGEQHFKKDHYFNKASAIKKGITTEEYFAQSQERDEIKNKYCEENNIKLIRIYDKNKIEEILKEAVDV